jgi:hypothetical protein
VEEHDGDIVFKSPTREFLRFKGDGTILVEGRRACSDQEIVSLFRRWLSHGTLTRPDGSKEPAHSDEPATGDLTFQSGVGTRRSRGGHVVLESGIATATISGKTNRPDLDGCNAEILWALVKKHGFLRVLRVLEGEALKLGPMSGVRLAEQISPSRFEGSEPMDEAP